LSIIQASLSNISLFEFPYFSNYTKIILLWQVPDVLLKGSFMRTPVLKFMLTKQRNYAKINKKTLDKEGKLLQIYQLRISEQKQVRYVNQIWGMPGCTGER
jgi:hypothetical protein